MKPLKILVLEDSPDDVFLIERKLRNSGMQFDTLVVDDKGRFETALADFQPDVILSDHSLPGVSVVEAFEIYKRYERNTNALVPFILVSGMVPEDLAVMMIKAGAHDYILKDRLKRLPVAIEGAIEKCRIENERLQFLRQLTIKEAMMSEAEALAHLGSWQVDLVTGQHTWSDMLYSLYGFEIGEVQPGNDVFFKLAHPEDREALKAAFEAFLQTGSPNQAEFRLVDNRGKLKYLSCTCKLFRDSAGNPVKLLGMNLDVTDRKKAEMALKRQEQEYRSLFDLNPDPIISLDMEGRLTNVNKAFTDVSGYSQEQVKGKAFSPLFHQEDVGEVNKRFRASRERNSQRYEARLVSAAGTVVFLDVTSIPIVVDEEVIGVHLVAKDITATKKLVNLLDEVYRQSRTGAWEFNVEQGKLSWTGITKELHEVDTGFEPDVDTAIQFYKEGESRDKITAAVRMGIQSGTPWDLELEITTAKGNDRWVRAIGGAEIREGKCVRLFGTFQDIHDRKMAELTVQESYREKIRILESIGDAFFAVDKNWVVTYWNKHSEALLGMPRERIIGKNLWEIYTEVDHLAFSTKYRRAMEANTPVHFEEYYAPLALWLQVSAYPSPGGLSIYFKDVTEQKKREEELSEQNARLREIAWLQSHELRAPLARILGLTHLIKERAINSDDELQVVVSSLEMSAGELDDVVRRIVRKTEAEAGYKNCPVAFQPRLFVQRFWLAERLSNLQ